TSLQGYALAELAPGHTMLFDALPTVHHQLLAHGIAATILRDHGARQASPTINHSLILPETSAETDLLAAGTLDSILNRLFPDPLLLGTYPDLTGFGVEMAVADGELEHISTQYADVDLHYSNRITTHRGTGPSHV